MFDTLPTTMNNFTFKERKGWIVYSRQVFCSGFHRPEHSTIYSGL